MATGNCKHSYRSSALESYGNCLKLTSAILEDCNQLVELMESKEIINFETFTAAWQELSFSLIYHTKPGALTWEEFTQDVLTIIKFFWLPPSPIRRRRIATYLIYGAYFKQPLVKRCGKIRLTQDDWNHITAFFKSNENKDCQELQFMFYKLFSSAAFTFNFCSISFHGSLAWSRALMATHDLFLSNPNNHSYITRQVLSKTLPRLDKAADCIADCFSSLINEGLMDPRSPQIDLKFRETSINLMFEKLSQPFVSSSATQNQNAMMNSPCSPEETEPVTATETRPPEPPSVSVIGRSRLSRLLATAATTTQVTDKETEILPDQEDASVSSTLVSKSSVKVGLSAALATVTTASSSTAVTVESTVTPKSTVNSESTGDNSGAGCPAGSKEPDPGSSPSPDKDKQKENPIERRQRLRREQEESSAAKALDRHHAKEKRRRSRSKGGKKVADSKKLKK